MSEENIVDVNDKFDGKYLVP